MDFDNSNLRTFRKVSTLQNEGICSAVTNNLANTSILRAGLSKNIEFSSKENWLNIGKGWMQCTPSHTGGLVRCGLQTIIESNGNNILFCLYEPPKPIETYKVADSSNDPEYDLGFSAKISTTNSELSRLSCFYVVVAFKSELEFVSIAYCPKNKWYDEYPNLLVLFV